MPKNKPAVPDTGPLPKPESPAEAREYLKATAFDAPEVQTIAMAAVEFSSVCPRTGQPDYGTVTIEYTPAQRCVESRALKYYLWSYRDEPAFCEAIAARIADDIMYAIAPESLEVEVTQNVRGGIGIVATARRPG
jgi:7-cyano-7-deazaguanine reductase